MQGGGDMGGHFNDCGETGWRLGWWMVDDGAAAGEARWCVLSNLVFSDDYTDHIYVKKL